MLDTIKQSSIRFGWDMASSPRQVALEIKANIAQETRDEYKRDAFTRTPVENARFMIDRILAPTRTMEAEFPFPISYETALSQAVLGYDAAMKGSAVDRLAFLAGYPQAFGEKRPFPPLLLIPSVQADWQRKVAHEIETFRAMLAEN